MFDPEDVSMMNLLSGKTYKTRDGRKILILGMLPKSETSYGHYKPFFAVSDTTYFPDGSWMSEHKTEHDLISEWNEEDENRLLTLTSPFADSLEFFRPFPPFKIDFHMRRQCLEARLHNDQFLIGYEGNTLGNAFQRVYTFDPREALKLFNFFLNQGKAYQLNTTHYVATPDGIGENFNKETLFYWPDVKRMRAVLLGDT